MSSEYFPDWVHGSIYPSFLSYGPMYTEHAEQKKIHRPRFIEFFQIGMENRDIVVLKQGDNIIGFAHIYDNKSKFIGPPIYWKNILGDNYGGLGPIGVDKDYRECGLGLLTLYRSLEILKSRSVKKMVIDWTDKDIIHFYGKFNFMPWKKYTKATKII